MQQPLLTTAVNRDRPAQTASDSGNRKPLKQSGIDRYCNIVSKRSRSPSKSPANPAKVAKDSGAGTRYSIATKNRFDALTDKDDTSGQVPKAKSRGNTKSVTEEQVPRPVNKTPPVYFRGMMDTTLVERIKQLIGPKFTISPFKRGNIQECRIQTSDSDTYRKLVAYLESRKYSFYSFALKDTQGPKFVMMNIEYYVSTAEIKEELAHLGFKIKSIFAMWNRNKTPLNMFKIELDPSSGEDETNRFLELNLFMQRSIKIEIAKRRTEPIQCTNCNEFGHSKSYCHLENICVFCAGHHDSKSCDTANTDRKCSNCGEQHTANYKGCMIYKHERKSMHSIPATHKTNKKSFTYKKDEFKPLGISNTQPQQTFGGTNYANYADIVRRGDPNTSPRSDIEGAMIKLTLSMETFMTNMQNTIQTLVQTMNTLMNVIAKRMN